LALLALLYHQGGTTLASYAWTYTDSGEPLLLEGTSNTDWSPNGGLPSEFVDQGMLPVHDTQGVVDAIASGGYAELSRLVSCTSLDGTVTYSYDPTGQLIAADYSDDSIPDESYSYDPNGNRVTANGYVYTTGEDNRLLSDGTFWYDYDPEGNRVARYIDVNVNGILDSGDTDVTKYTWDARNRLVRVADYPVEGAPPEQVVDYLYDLENRWIGKLVDSDGDGTVDQRTAFAYDGNQIVLQFENDGDADLTPDDLSHRYLWQPDAVDQIMADEQVASPDAEGDVLWPLGDHLGTVRDLAVHDPATDTTTVANHITYNAYGRKLSETNAAIDSLFGFTGRPFDETTGLQNNLNRWYDANTGRWMSKDPIGFEGKDANAYRYVGNGPINAIDPNGLKPPKGPHILASDPIETADESRALELCNGDPDLEKAVRELFEVIRQSPSPRWLLDAPKTIPFGGRCVWWAITTLRKILDAKAQGKIQGIAVEYEWKYYVGPNPLWSEHHYLKATPSNGNVFYLDVYWLGGNDHIFFDLPNSLSDHPRPDPPPIPGGWSVCFNEGTQVHTETGLQNIEEVSVGMKVWAYDHEQEAWSLMPVIDTEAHDFDGEMVTLKVGEDTIEATTTHPFWVISGEDLASRRAQRIREGDNPSSIDSGQWVAAGELRSGDVLLSRERQLLTIVSAETKEIRVRIHNLMVDCLNNYAVGKAGLLVNNM